MADTREKTGAYSHESKALEDNQKLQMKTLVNLQSV